MVLSNLYVDICVNAIFVKFSIDFILKTYLQHNYVLCVYVCGTASQGRQTNLILLDFSKEFDKVNHIKLLHKLHQHGARGTTVSWIKAFLTGRSQTVVLEGESSSEIPVNSGVPQGSVLGLLLFLLYINDLSENIHPQVRPFADDTASYITINSHSDSDTLQQDLDTLQTWERLWDMDFNQSKCKVLHISKSRNLAQYVYILHGLALEAMDHAKYLGVDISNDLSWNTHINRISTNANKTQDFLKGTSSLKTQQSAQLHTKPLVRPQVEYHPQYGALSLKPTLIRLKWPKEGPCGGSTATIPHMLV